MNKTLITALACAAAGALSAAPIELGMGMNGDVHHIQTSICACEL